MHYLLFYNLADDYLERRVEFRNEHLKLAWEYQKRGELILGGALQEPTDAAVLLFSSIDTSTVEKFIANDPYIKNGLIKNWSIRTWSTVVGDLADTPIRISK